MVIDPEKVRYFLAGGLNTALGYGIGIATYKLLAPFVHIIFIGVISNVIAITASFFVYKIFVFRSAGNWISEYMRSYVVYGGMALFGIALIWAMVDKAGLSIWIAQGVAILVTAGASYLGHSRFTFRRHNSPL